MADQPGSQNLRARPEQHEEQAFDHLGQAFRPLPSTSTATTAAPSRLAGTLHTPHPADLQHVRIRIWRAARRKVNDYKHSAGRPVARESQHVHVVNVAE